MDAYKIITQKGLKTQDLVDDDRVISSVEEPVSSIESDLVAQLREQPARKPVVVGYDNTVAFLPGQHDRFPTVSMGHFFLADTLNNLDNVRNSGSTKGRRFVDLGCGAGFLGNYIANNFPSIMPHGRVSFCDLFPESMNAALSGYLFNQNISHEEFEKRIKVKTAHGLAFSGNHGESIDFRIGDANQTMYGDNADVSVASPIYIPEICEVFPKAFALFGAVSKHVGADLYVAHSSLSDKVVEEAARQTGAKLTDINSREFALDLSTTDSRRNEFGEETVEKLLPLGLIVQGTGDNVQYGHQLRVSKMSYK